MKYQHLSPRFQVYTLEADDVHRVVFFDCRSQVTGTADKLAFQSRRRCYDWGPYLSLEDTYLLDDVKELLKSGDIATALSKARVFTLTGEDH